MTITISPVMDRNEALCNKIAKKIEAYCFAYGEKDEIYVASTLHLDGGSAVFGPIIDETLKSLIQMVKSTKLKGNTISLDRKPGNNLILHKETFDETEVNKLLKLLDEKIEALQGENIDPKLATERLAKQFDALANNRDPITVLQLLNALITNAAAIPEHTKRELARRVDTVKTLSEPTPAAGV